MYLDATTASAAIMGIEMVSGGHKAFIAISEDSENGVTKYRSEQDMVSICK
jgi:hypothetical protein